MSDSECFLIQTNSLAAGRQSAFLLNYFSDSHLFPHHNGIGANLKWPDYKLFLASGLQWPVPRALLSESLSDGSFSAQATDLEILRSNLCPKSCWWWTMELEDFAVNGDID